MFKDKKSVETIKYLVITDLLSLNASKNSNIKDKKQVATRNI